MSLLLELVHNTSVVYNRYLQLHDDMFRMSVRKVVEAMVPGRGVNYRAHDQELESLCSKLLLTDEALAKLSKEDLVMRHGLEIKSRLSEYIQALVESIRRLQVICRGKTDQRINEAGEQSVADLQDSMVSYDDAVQYHKQLGAVLTRLLETY